MSILCKILGHKNTQGVIETYSEIIRCERCNKQIVIFKNNILSNELRDSAEAMEKVNNAVDRNVYTEKEIEDYRKAADLVDKEKEEKET